MVYQIGSNWCIIQSIFTSTSHSVQATETLLQPVAASHSCLEIMPSPLVSIALKASTDRVERPTSWASPRNEEDEPWSGLSPLRVCVGKHCTTHDLIQHCSLYKQKLHMRIQTACIMQGGHGKIWCNSFFDSKRIYQQHVVLILDFLPTSRRRLMENFNWDHAKSWDHHYFIQIVLMISFQVTLGVLMSRYPLSQQSQRIHSELHSSRPVLRQVGCRSRPSPENGSHLRQNLNSWSTQFQKNSKNDYKQENHVKSE